MAYGLSRERDLVVLFVEDEEVIRDSFSSMLRAKFENVLVADNGEDALKLFESNRVDIVISDIIMPKLNGVKLAKEIKKIAPSTFVMLVTASNDHEYLMEAIEAGVNRFILKPLNVKSFFEVLDAVCSEQKIKKELAEKDQLLEEYKTAVDASNIVSKTDTKGIITYANQAFCDTSGYSIEELIGKPQNIVRHPNMPKSVFKEMWETIQSKHIYKGVVENKRKDGSSYFVDATIVPILGVDGEIIEYLGIRHDITEFINNKQKLYTNALTGLPNRYKLSSDLTAGNGGSLAVINVDSFKILNDYYGSNIGDMVLVELAGRFVKIFGSNNLTVYKLSSDEYGIFCEECKSDFVDEITRGVHLATIDSIRCGDVDIVTSVTAGIAVGKDGLLEKANMALGFAKKYKKQISVYDESMLIGKNYEKNITISKTLREAIDGDWFVPYFQPIVNCVTNEIEKYETLVRIVKPSGEVLSPMEFLDVAKATRLYPHITRTMIAKAFEIFKNKKESFSVNLSVEDILDEHTRAFVLGMLGGYGISDRVIFEILESEGIENYGDVSEFLTAAKKFGVKIAIDDFGTGYSNFEHLAKLNVDIIKIDGSLIRNIDTNSNSEIIVETIVSFAKKLGMQSVAEFVHSKEVYDKIKKIGIDYAQGYLLGKPDVLSEGK